jgi:toxin ParE1/3/4
MWLRWAEEAADGLERITDYLFENAPGRAADIVGGIYDALSALLQLPHRGRPGRRERTRELVLSPLPYIVVYQIVEDVINIVRILHGATEVALKGGKSRYNLC